MRPPNDRREQEPSTRKGWRRLAARAVVAYLVAVLLAQAAILTAVVVSRFLGGDPRTGLGGVPNARAVDDTVWAGGQPHADGYRRLAARGVRLVVDLRTGAADDPTRADPALLARLGLDYLRLPVPDGHVPSRDQVARFADAVRRTDGDVFVHCGGGVGRTSALTAAYRDAKGADVRFTDHAAVGPHTVEQLWFVATGGTNPVVRRASEALDAPRRAWSRLRSLL